MKKVAERTLREEVDLLTEVLREISHAPQYNGSLCEDPEDCPNCYAQKTLREQAARLKLKCACIRPFIFPAPARSDLVCGRCHRPFPRGGPDD